MVANDVWISATCGGETCAICGLPATDKVGEEIPIDDPAMVRHNLTAYVCRAHFIALFGERGVRLRDEYRAGLRIIRGELPTSEDWESGRQKTIQRARDWERGA